MKLHSLLLRLSDWLACGESPRKADLIFVLAGRRYRKVYGLQLFSEAFSPRIILSVGRFELRGFPSLSLPVPVDLLARASHVPPPQRHYFVAYHKGGAEVTLIRVRRFGTLGEIEALAEKLNKRTEPTTVLVVSSGAHLRRIRLCCRVLFAKHIHAVMLAAPAETWDDSEDTAVRWLHEASAITVELEKLLMYWIILAFRSRIR
jgi:uncharacterized SAM-binding protein YcdF (DUF218 family)